MLNAIQTINHYITYSVITSSPELTYSSVLSTIRLFPVTSGDLEGSTFVEWTGNFSSDADAGKSSTRATVHGDGPELHDLILTMNCNATSTPRSKTALFLAMEMLTSIRCYPRRQIQTSGSSRRSRQSRGEEIERPMRMCLTAVASSRFQGMERIG